MAQTLRADPADRRTLQEWGQQVAASGRTLARAFVAETGVPFGRWRTLLRLQAALPMLADGEPVSRVAGRVGYDTPSAFVAAFRRDRLTVRAPCPTWPSARSSTGRPDEVASCSAAHIL